MAGACPSFDRAAAVAFAMELRSAAGALQDSIDAARELQHISLPVGRGLLYTRPLFRST